MFPTFVAYSLYSFVGFKANGSARVRIGGTDVIASVKVLPLLLFISTLSLLHE